MWLWFDNTHTTSKCVESRSKKNNTKAAKSTSQFSKGSQTVTCRVSEVNKQDYIKPKRQSARNYLPKHAAMVRCFPIEVTYSLHNLPTTTNFSACAITHAYEQEFQGSQRFIRDQLTQLSCTRLRLLHCHLQCKWAVDALKNRHKPCHCLEFLWPHFRITLPNYRCVRRQKLSCIVSITWQSAIVIAKFLYSSGNTSTNNSHSLPLFPMVFTCTPAPTPSPPTPLSGDPPRRLSTLTTHLYNAASSGQIPST